jgi:hypothetical protein
MTANSVPDGRFEPEQTSRCRISPNASRAPGFSSWHARRSTWAIGFAFGVVALMLLGAVSLPGGLAHPFQSGAKSESPVKPNAQVSAQPTSPNSLGSSTSAAACGNGGHLTNPAAGTPSAQLAHPAGTTGPSPLFNSQVTPYAKLTGPYDYVAGGAALRDQGYGYINLTWPGGTSAVVGAYLVWSILNSTVPPTNGTINGVNINGTWVAYATPSPCWTPTYIYTFVDDVTGDVVNGSNVLANFPDSTVSGANPWAAAQTQLLDDGASLVVIYDNSSRSTDIHQITLYTGAAPIGSPASNIATAQLNYSTTNSTGAKTTYMVSDGQLPGNYAVWNGTTIDSNAFPGSDPKASSIPWSYGNLSDTKTYSVSVAKGSNNTTAEVASSGADCLTWIGQVVNVGVAAKKGPYPVEFEEQGLPNGTVWNITTHGKTNSSVVVNGTSSVNFSLNNSTSYTYKVGAVSGFISSGSGKFQVKGGPVFIRVIFHELLFVVTFDESGLPLGVTWWVDLKNTTQSVSENLTAYTPAGATFYEGNGTYSYLAGEIGLYLAVPPNSNVTVTGANLLITVQFVPPPLYNVTFAQHGLPAGKVWGGDVETNWGSFDNSTSQASFTLQLPNNTAYGDLIYPTYVPGYSAPPEVYFAVSGMAETIQVNYTQVYLVQFTETGLSHGTTWEMYLSGVNGSTYSYAYGTELNFTTVTNGTYTFLVQPIWSYTATPVNGTVVVHGANVSAAIVFSPAPTYTLTFTETGLAAAAPWSVALTLPNDTELIVNSTVTTLAFSLPNGSYEYLASAHAYVASPVDGYIPISGADENYNISFSRIYSATFTETGIPSDTYWYVYFGDSYYGSYTPNIYIWIPNGTYDWTAYSVYSFTPTPSEGSFNIIGSDVAQTISYVSPEEPTYTLTFTETGLPSLTNWTASLNGIIETSTGASIVFTEPNGTYDFSAGATGYTAVPADGQANVSGANYTETINFGENAGPFAVTFTESGLSLGTSWSVTLDGVLNTSTTGTIGFTEPDGTYDYTVSAVTGYYAPNPATGEISVSGTSPPPTNVVFTPTTAPTFTVTFSESGLTAGTSWSVTLNGVTTPSTTTTVSFVEPNGSYDYSIGAVSGYRASLAAGTVIVAGANASESVAFTAVTPVTYSVTFTESGLASGASWTVTLGSVPRTEPAGTAIVFSGLANNTYSYTIANVSGYNVTPTASTVIVDGDSPSIAVTFTATTPSTNPTGSSGGLSTLDWAIIGAVIALAALLVLFFLIAGRRRKKDDQSQLPPTIPPKAPPPPPGNSP